jgi:hypothetical protein
MSHLRRHCNASSSRRLDFLRPKSVCSKNNLPRSSKKTRSSLLRSGANRSGTLYTRVNRIGAHTVCVCHYSQIGWRPPYTPGRAVAGPPNSPSRRALRNSAPRVGSYGQISEKFDFGKSVAHSLSVRRWMRLTVSPTRNSFEPRWIPQGTGGAFYCCPLVASTDTLPTMGPNRRAQERGRAAARPE